MRTRRTGTAIAITLLILLVLAGLVQAQGPTSDDTDQTPVGIEIFADPATAPAMPAAAPILGAVEPEAPAQPDLPEEPLSDASLSATMSDIIPFQGRLTSAGGAPVNGNRSITLSLYDVSGGGTALCTDTDTVNVTNGLFVFNMNFCSASDTDGKQLYLGVKVGADPEMTPRQAVYPVPFARSVRPGAIINQTATGERGLTVQSTGSGAAGAALWVQNTNTTSGIGLWSTVSGNDAAIIAGSNGSGAFFKGFGPDGGEDEIRINNNGSIETRADSFFYVPGAALVKNLSADTTRWDIQASGAARIWRGGAAGSKYVYYPLTIPTQLYGRAVKVESVTVYYRDSDGTKGYITGTHLRKQNDADSYTQLISDATDRTSNLATNYTLSTTEDNILSSNQGLVLLLELSFADDTNWVQIGGIRIRLGHHSLY